MDVKQTLFNTRSWLCLTPIECQTISKLTCWVHGNQAPNLKHFFGCGNRPLNGREAKPQMRNVKLSPKREAKPKREN